MSGNSYRRMRWFEAARLVPLYFIGMFGGSALWDFLSEPSIDWEKHLLVAVGFTILMSMANMALKLTPRS